MVIPVLGASSGPSAFKNHTSHFFSDCYIFTPPQKKSVTLAFNIYEARRSLAKALPVNKSSGTFCLSFCRTCRLPLPLSLGFHDSEYYPLILSSDVASFCFSVPLIVGFFKVPLQCLERRKQETLTDSPTSTIISKQTAPQSLPPHFS